jgi:acyl transferase domain-containing protein/NADPH:quinone reductase-like Zn-dependent oxidoreductase/acyl carrier protein
VDTTGTSERRERGHHTRSADQHAVSEPIAVIGIGCRVPGGANTPDAFWRLLLEGGCPVRDVPLERWDVGQYYDQSPEAAGKTYVRRGTFLDHIDQFDPAAFGITPREAVTIDPQQRLLLEVGREAIEDAGYAPDALHHSDTGVFIGIAGIDYASMLLAQPPERLDAYVASGTAHSMASGRLSYVFGLQGPSLSIDTACSSSLVAIHEAVQSLRRGECSLALAGGVNVMVSPLPHVLFSRARMLSPDGICKAFDASADGFGRGEGCGVVVLRRLSDARACGDRVLAVIRGTAVGQDGPSSGLTAPNGPAQEAVIRRALADAGVRPWEIDYVEAHGTGTALGDPIEVQALAAAYSEGRTHESPLLIGSVKTNVGHLEAASGVTGLIKLVLSLRHGELPSHLHFTRPSPHINWHSMPIEVVTDRRPWPDGGGRRMGAVSSFGFSGTNAHVIVEQPPASNVAGPSRAPEIVTIGARTATGLQHRLRDLGAHLETHPDLELGDVAFTANAGRAAGIHRTAIVAASLDALQAAIRGLLDGVAVANAAQGISPADPPRLAFLFTGQGSQYAGMGRDLYEHQPLVREVLDQCDGFVFRKRGRSLLDVMFGHTSDGSINDTEWTQPALFALEYALARLWMSWGIRPAALIGHSVGEFAAACVAGALSLEDALCLVTARGALMNRLPRDGGMASLRASEPVVAALVHPWREAVAIAAINAPDEVVISGRKDALEAVLAECQLTGIRSRTLNVSHAFHSPLMDPVLSLFGATVGDVTARDPEIPVVSNVTGHLLTADDLRAGDYWVRQLRQTVRFADGLRTLRSRGVDLFLEVGPAPVLASLASRTLEEPGLKFYATVRPDRNDSSKLLETLGLLHVAGCAIDWTAVHAGRGRRVALPLTPFERTRHWPEFVRASDLVAATDTLRARRLDSPALASHVFEVTLRPARLPFLSDHVVAARTIAPAAALIQLIRMNASAVLGSTDVEIHDLVFAEPLVCEHSGSIDVQVVFASAGSRTVEVYSRSRDTESASWLRHAEARVAPVDDEGRPSEILIEIQSRCTRPQTQDDHYGGLAARGLELGPALRAVTAVWQGEREALGRLGSPSLGGDDSAAAIAAIDSAIQLVAEATSGDIPDTDAYLPFGVERVMLTEKTASASWAHAVTRAITDDGRTVSVDLDLRDEAGEVVAFIKGLSLRPLHIARKVENWLHEPVWRTAPRPDRTRSAADVCLAAERALAGWAAHADVRHYEAGLLQIEQLAGAYLERAMVQLGWSLSPAETLEISDLQTRLGVADRHRSLFTTLVDTLSALGVVSCRNGICAGVRLPEGAHVESLRALLYKEFPECEAETTLLVRCGERLADVLRGDVDPLDLLFPAGDSADVERLYSHSPPAILFNRALQTAIGSGALHGLRVLELGGGTGSTTGYVREVAGSVAQYTFTDVSPTFVRRAAKRFADWTPFDARVLDLEREPAEQGFSGEQFDVIIAANVMHATADLQATLRRVRSVLAPGGLLILLEAVRPQRWVDLTFGLTVGWWAFTDRHLRTTSPLLKPATWQRVLAEEGFVAADAAPRGASTGVLALHAMVCASTPAQRPHGTTVVHSVPDQFASELAQSVTMAGGDVTRMGPADSLGTLSDADRFVFVFDADPVTDQDSAESLMTAIRPTFARLLACAQAFVGGGRSGATGCIVTRGACAVTDDTRLNLSHAVVNGFVTALQREQTGTRWIHVDLDTEPNQDDGAVVLAELMGSSVESAVAFRAGVRYVRRLARPRPLATSPTRLVVGTPGTLDTLRWCETRPPEPGAGEIRIRVQAAGLNFRDVLNALGTLAAAVGPLGIECSGIVEAIGPGVDTFSIGDDVIAIVPGALATTVVADARLVVRRPTTWTATDGAAFPVAFVTASYALEHIGHLRHGDRVLIHSAAGGVGLAAVRIAQGAGAEVFATAGTEDKRRRLRGLGIEHVFDSRSTSFAERIIAATKGRGVTVVLNALGGEAIPASLSVLAKGGRFLEIGKKDAWSVDRVYEARPDVQYSLVDWSDLTVNDPEAVGNLLRGAITRYGDGPMPLPVTPYEAEHVEDALRFLGSGRLAGKIAVTFDAVTKPESFRIRSAASYLITGGLSGLGLETARWFVRRGAEHLLLVGRREPLPAVAEEISAWRALGLDIEVLHCDVSDEPALVATLRTALATRPPLRGIVHSAGLLDDAALLQQDWARFEYVLAPKVKGAWALHQYTRNSDLDFFVLFSSLASVLGSPGQTNHASASAFLDGLAHYRRQEGHSATSLDWGVWNRTGAGVRYGVVDRAAKHGVGLIEPDDGLRALEATLDTGRPQMAIAPIQWGRFVASAGASLGALVSELVDSPAPVADGRTDARARSVLVELNDAPVGRRTRILAEFVHREAATVLGLADRSELSGDRPIRELGLDSLMAVELRNLLGRELDQKLPATLLFDYPTVAGLSQFLLKRLFPTVEERPAAPRTPALAVTVTLQTEETLARIESLSDAEIEALLGNGPGLEA